MGSPWDRLHTETGPKRLHLGRAILVISAPLIGVGKVRRNVCPEVLVIPSSFESFRIKLDAITRLRYEISF